MWGEVVEVRYQVPTVGNLGVTFCLNKFRVRPDEHHVGRVGYVFVCLFS
jgi:hypothetical protein